MLEDLHGEFFVRKADWVADMVAAARGGDAGGEWCGGRMVLVVRVMGGLRGGSF